MNDNPSGGASVAQKTNIYATIVENIEGVRVMVNDAREGVRSVDGKLYGFAPTAPCTEDVVQDSPSGFIPFLEDITSQLRSEMLELRDQVNILNGKVSP